jgi:uncharacterized membrane protein YedE/YeeE
VLSAGCIVWLERFQPLYATVAVVALAYQTWLVWRRPPQRRTRMMHAILWSSIGTSVVVAGIFVGLWLRYR